MKEDSLEKEYYGGEWEVAKEEQILEGELEEKKSLKGLFCVLQVKGYSVNLQMFNGAARIASFVFKPQKKRKKKDKHPTFRRVQDSIDARVAVGVTLKEKEPWKELFPKCGKIFIHCSTKKCYSVLFGEFNSKEVMGKKMDRTRRKNNRKKMTIASIEVAASENDQVVPILSRGDGRLEDLSSLLTLSSLNSKCAKLLRKHICARYNLTCDPKFPQIAVESKREESSEGESGSSESEDLEDH